MINVSIIFVNYKTKDLTIKAIKSVVEKTKNLEYEIFVVDNNSQDGSIEEIEKEFPNINIIKNPINAGFGAANNLAIKQAKGKYIFCLNTDTLLINNAIKTLYDFMEKEENQNVGVCGGYLVDKYNIPTICGGHFPSFIDVLYKTGIRKILPQYYKKYSTSLKSDEKNYLKSLDYITGADILFRKSVLDKVGLFDEQFFMYYEETDLCKRIKDAGYEVKFVEEAKIQHLENQSAKNNLHHISMVKTSEMIYFNKHHPKQLWLIKSIYTFLYLFDWLIFGNKNSKEIIKYVLKFPKYK